MQKPTSNKILALLLVAAMVFTMMPLTAFAEGEIPLGDSGYPATPTDIIVAAFDELDDFTLYQGYDFDTVTLADLDLPDTLSGTDADGEVIAIDGVTWQSDPDFDPAAEVAFPGYIFTPTLPEGYALADGVTAPVITVFIRPEGGVKPQPLAATGTLSIGGSNQGNLTNTLSGTGWAWDPSSNTLTLTGNITGGIFIDCAGTDTINLAYNGAVTVGNEVGNSIEGQAIRCSGNLNINGSGTLTISKANAAGIFAIGSVTISGTVGDITAKGSGISTAGSVTISGEVGNITADFVGIDAGSVTISGTVGNITAGINSNDGSGIFAQNSVTIEANGKVGNITGDNGIRARDGDITISGTVGKITTNNSISDGSGIFAKNNVTIETGGNVGDIISDYGIRTTNGDIAISGTVGDFYIGSAAGVYAGSGNISISGTVGKITASSGQTSSGIWANEGDVTIEAGGEVGDINSSYTSIYADGDITIGGIVGNIAASISVGVFADTGDITIEGDGEVGNITGTGGFAAHTKDITIAGTVGTVTGADGDAIHAMGSGGVTISGTVGDISASSIDGNGIWTNGGPINIDNYVTVSGGKGAFSAAPTISLTSYTATWSDKIDGSSPSTGSAYTWNAGHQYVKIAVAGSGATDITADFTDPNFLSAVRTALGKGASDLIYDTDVAGETWLDVAYKSIESLAGIQHFTSLEELFCFGNQITALPATLPSGLINLSCDDNLLTALPVTLPSGLISLGCADNQLTVLPALPSGLVSLSCKSNQLTALPALPSDLTFLECQNNQLTALPALPFDLSYLDCRQNLLAAGFDVTGLGSLTYLDCRFNNMADPSAVTGFTGTWDDGVNFFFTPQNIPGMPTITGISPTSGSMAGGTSVTLTGTNLTGATAVTVGGADATGFTVNSATQITFTTPAGTAGAKDVAVTTPGGTDTLTGGFTYIGGGTADTTPPTPGGSGTITATNVAQTTLTLNWTKATDTVSAQSALKYYVYHSASNNIGTAANCASNGTLINAGGTADIAALNVIGLTANTTYYFNVVVEDAAGNKAAYTMMSQATAAVPTYLVTVNSGTGGGSYAQGAIVTITANTPSAGQQFKEWTVVSGGVTLNNAQAQSTTFTMPAQAVTVTATYEALPASTYSITVQNDGNGTANANVNSAAEGIQITLTATPNSRYQFKEWQVISGGVTITGNSFTMPASNVTVKAIFEPAATYTITFNPNGGTVSTATMQTGTNGKLASLPTPTRSGSYSFDGWFTSSSGGTKITTNTVFTANDTVYAHWMYIGGGSGGGGGGGTTTTTSPSTVTGDTVTPQVTTDSASGVTSASVTGNEVNAALDNAKAAAGAGENPVVVIDVSAPVDAATIQTIIPSAAFGTIRNSANTDLTIQAGSATLTFSDAALSGITGTGDVVITAGLANPSNLNEEQKELVGDRPVYDFSVTVGGKVITDFGGGVSISVPYAPKAGENPNAIVVYYIDAQGNVQTIQNGVYDSATGTVSFTTDHFSLYMIGYNLKTFSDTGSHWAKDNITFAAARELFSGTGNGNFSPDSSMTRAMFVTVLWRMDGQTKVDGLYADFADVVQGSWYENAVGWAAKNGIAGGIGEGFFAPEAPITREQMAVMLDKYIQYKGYKLPTGTVTVFTDETQIASWAKDSVKAIQSAGIISGKPGNLFDPQGTATRGEVATIFARFIEILAK